jgi:hypothetical protein
VPSREKADRLPSAGVTYDSPQCVFCRDHAKVAPIGGFLITFLRVLGTADSMAEREGFKLQLVADSQLFVADRGFRQCLCGLAVFADFGCRVLPYALECPRSRKFGITGITCSIPKDSVEPPCGHSVKKKYAGAVAE